jgi:hypothetical protein
MEPDARQGRKQMAQNDTLRKATERTIERCCKCRESIKAGEFYYTNKKMVRHSECAGAAPVASAPVAPAPVAAPAYRTFGALRVDESFTAWEREYEREG